MREARGGRSAWRRRRMPTLRGGGRCSIPGSASYQRTPWAEAHAFGFLDPRGRPGRVPTPSSGPRPARLFWHWGSEPAERRSLCPCLSRTPPCLSHCLQINTETMKTGFRGGCEGVSGLALSAGPACPLCVDQTRHDRKDFHVTPRGCFHDVRYLGNSFNEGTAPAPGSTL